MRKTLSALFVLAAFSLPVMAHADASFSGTLVTETFNSGAPPTFNPAGVFSGTYGASTGTATVTITGVAPEVLSVFDNTSGTDLTFTDPVTGYDLDLVFFNGLGLSGSPFCDLTNCAPGTGSAFDQGPFSDYLVATSSASFTVTPAVTPEPSSLILLGTGAMGLAGMVRRRLTR